jgi:hypothetical protein
MFTRSETTKTIENKWFYFFLILFVHGLLLFSFLGTTSARFTKLFGADKFVSDEATAYYICFALLFSSAFVFGSKIGGPAFHMLFSLRRSRLNSRTLLFLLFGCAILVVVGHLSLYLVGHAVLSRINDATANKLDTNLTGTGAPLFLTTFLPLFAALLGFSIFSQHSKRIVVLACIIALLTFICVVPRFLYFERLPLFELGTPLAWFLLRRLSFKTVVLIAFGGLLSFFALFSLAEYFRSWPLYLQSGLYQNTPSDFLEFMFYRVMGYYITPVNHLGAIVEQHLGHTTGGFYTFRFILNTPVIGHIVTSVSPYLHKISVNSADIWEFLVDPHFGLNPEYNLFGFYGVSFLDWGWGGLILATLFGTTGGMLLAASRRRLTLGVFGFPIFLIGLAECPRLLYWSHERVFLSLLALLLISFAIPRVTDEEEDLEGRSDAI